MKNDANPKAELGSSLPTISAEEFDAMFDAGEDVSAYIDWDSGVMVAPGELSPGQKLAMQESIEAGGVRKGELPLSKAQPILHISLPPWAFDQLQSEAIRQGVSHEELAQLLIVQKFDKEKVLP